MKWFFIIIVSISICTGGINGVYEIEDLIEVLRRDNARQIFVATVPKEYSYVDYIVVVSGKTQRHMNALATFVRKIFKMKKLKSDSIPKIEGENSKDWIALDLGNLIFCNKNYWKSKFLILLIIQ